MERSGWWVQQQMDLAEAQSRAFCFRTVNSTQEFGLQLLSEVLKVKARCKMMAWKSPEESRLLRSKCEPFFRTPKA